MKHSPAIFKRLLWAALALFGLCTHALGQSTVGELLDSGGTLLVGEDLTKVILSDTWNLDAHTISYSADGTFRGLFSSRTGSGQLLSNFGTWSLDSDGRLCTKFIDLRFRGIEACRYWYRYKDGYFASRDLDRSRPLFTRAHHGS
jgi:hypothetical protein